MMDAMIRIARGEPDPSLLQSCRLAGWGAERYGRKEIIAAFQTAPDDLTDGHALVSGNHAVLISADAALFADTYGANIARLWRVGAGSARPRTPALAVPFDPDLSQLRTSVFFAPADHPDLSTDHHARLRNQLDALSTGARSGGRLFVLRAFSAGADLATLLAVYRHAQGGCPPRISYEILALIDGNFRRVTDSIDGAEAEPDRSGF